MKKIICMIVFISVISLYQYEIIANNKLVSKNEIYQLLNPDNIMWEKDSDGDGLPDALEKMIGTNINSKDSDSDGVDDKLEIELGLNPNKKDRDNNVIDDGDEDFDNDGLSNKYEINKFRNPKIDDKFITKVLTRGECIEITGKTLLESCNLAWKTINYDIVGKTIKEIFPNEYEQLHDFTVIRHTQTNGFSAIAIKNCDSVIVAYQASKTYRDWIGNFLTQFMPHPQRNAAIEFIKPIVKKEDKVYITGHSLGGLLAQYSTHYLSDNNYKKIKAVTFNSANNMNPKHIDGKYRPPIIKANLLDDYVLVYENVFSKMSKNKEKNNSRLIEFFNKSLKQGGFIDIYNNRWRESSFDSRYEYIIENHIVNKDPLYIIINGGYLGKKNIKNSSYQIENMENDSQELSSAHKLSNFENDENLNKVIAIE